MLPSVNYPRRSLQKFNKTWYLMTVTVSRKREREQYKVNVQVFSKLKEAGSLLEEAISSGNIQSAPAARE